MTDYYDALYQKSIDKYHFENRVFYETIEEGSEKIISFLDKNGIFLSTEEEPLNG